MGLSGWTDGGWKLEVEGQMTGWMSGSDTHKFFFHRFMRGMHKHVGAEVRRDEPLAIGIAKEVHRVLDKK